MRSRFLRSILCRRQPIASTRAPNYINNKYYSTTTSSLASTMIPSNQELVRKRIEVQRAKRAARRRSQSELHQRNLHVKHQIRNGTASPEDLIAIKISVGDELRNELRLSGREKRGRVFVIKEQCQTFRDLRRELHGFFRALKKSTYLLEAAIPQENMIASTKNTEQAAVDDVVVTTTAPPWDEIPSKWKVETDEDVVKSLNAAEQFFKQLREHQLNNNETTATKLLKRPLLFLHVLKNPDAPPPPPPPTYLDDMPDPSESPTMTMLSFYAFPPDEIDDPEEFAFRLRKILAPFQALGRIYIAKEGTNAQMAVPTNVLSNFLDCCTNHIVDELGQWMENGINIDPIPLTQEEFRVAGFTGKDPPFSNLHIRVRNQVVADGLSKPLDWQKAGYDMPPMEWHETLQKMQQHGSNDESEQQPPKPILLDCRNTYETDVGKFVGAEPLETEQFRDSWNVLKERLKDTPKDAPILTYCTGGIRCVKVGAYLTQEMGFQNVSRLAGGIIAYDRTLQEEKEQETPNSLFRGTNFVFDGRLGRPITQDQFAECRTCGSKTSHTINCANPACHLRMIQCETCQSSYQGTCSEACRQRLVIMKDSPATSVNGNMIPKRRTSPTSSDDSKDESSVGGKRHDSSAPAKTTITTLNEYRERHSTPPPSLYKELEFNTHHFVPTGSHMISGSEQGRWLTHLASMTKEGRILEIGTFTGFATISLVEGVVLQQQQETATPNKKDGDHKKEGPYVLSLERDERAFQVAAAHLDIVSKYGFGEEAAEAACALRSSPTLPEEEFSTTMSFPCGDDNENDNGNIVTCDLVCTTDALAHVEHMATSSEYGPFDFVFVDADKGRLLEYMEALISTDAILKKGGTVVVDNVLWKGLVMKNVDDDSVLVEEDSMMMHDEKKTRRARIMANKMHAFNQAIVQDNRVEVMMLPMRDGLSVIRKR